MHRRATTSWRVAVLIATLWFAPAPSSASDDVSDEAVGIDESDASTPAHRLPATRPQRPRLSNEKSAHEPFGEWEFATDDWFGWRSRIEDRGVTFRASVATDVFWDMTGGRRPGDTAIAELLNANLTVDTQRLFGWPGGTFFTNFQQSAGENGSDIVGDLQGLSNIDSSKRLLQVSELWYQQVLFSQRLRVKIGKVDANTEFARTINGAEFNNSSFGYSPTLVGFPTFPNPATSINVFAAPTGWLDLGAGIYDGATAEGIATGSRGPATFLGASVFTIGGAAVKWALAEQTLAGRLSGGIWNHSAKFERFDGGIDSGTSGFYFTFDQMLWRENPGKKDDAQGIASFAQYGWANPQVSEFADHIAGGLTWTGAVPGRDDDVLGLGFTFVRLSPEAGFGRDSELTIELFYKLQLLEWLSVKPDLQYIHNPGGSSELDDALVLTLRLEADI